MIVGVFGTGQVAFSLLFFFGMVLIVWLMIRIFADIFRSTDLSGLAKALWSLVVLFIPIFGAIAYLVVRGAGMGDRVDEPSGADYSRDGIPGGYDWAGARVMTQ